MNERVGMSSPEKDGIYFWGEEGKKEGGMKIWLNKGKQQRSHL